MEEIFKKLRDFQSVPQFSRRLTVEMKKDLPESLRKAWDLAVFEAESNIKPCPYGGE